jgi:hypothetical protein
MQFVFVGWCVGIASAAVFEFDVVVFDLARSCPNFFARCAAFMDDRDVPTAG